MLRCDKRVYEQCPDKEYCGSLDNAVFFEGSECDKYNRMVIADYTISKLLTTDVVEVVRCADCKHNIENMGHSVVCKYLSRYKGLTMPYNHFCKLGEWRDGE